MKLSEEKIQKKVHNFYWENDYNCATSMMKILKKNYGIKLQDQVYDAMVGMHGAGNYGAQCGLVEGALLFIGIFGRQQKMSDKKIIKHCYQFAEQFEKEFGSLKCSVLRPEGFKEDNPPHLCEELSNKAIVFTIKFIDQYMTKE